mgnify:CR=1 FL=1
MSRLIPVDRHTDHLLLSSVDDWLPNDHLARIVVDGVVWLNPEKTLETALLQHTELR